MENIKLKNKFWDQVSFKENRRIFQTPTAEKFGEAFLNAALKRAKEKLSLPKSISEALAAAINSLARILDASGTVIDSSSQLLVSGIDWAKLGFERLQKWSGKEEPPRDYWDEYRSVLKYFDQFDEGRASGGDAEKLKIIKDYPEIKKIVEAQMFVSFFNFKIKEVQEFYKPAMREHQKVRDRLQAIDVNQHGKQMEEYAKVELEIAGIEDLIKNSRSKDPRTESDNHQKLLVAKVRRTQLERSLSYNVEWAVPELLSCEFPPGSKPKQYISRFMPNGNKTMRLFLPDLVEVLKGQYENMEPLMKKYGEEVRRQAYVRDEQGRMLMERLVKQGMDEDFMKKVLGVIDGEFTRLDAEYQTSLTTIEPSFLRERDPSNPKVYLPPLVLVNPVVDPSTPLPPLKSTVGTPVNMQGVTLPP